MSYAKLFSTILDSTVWDTELATRVTWITLLAMADRDGLVEASVPGLARRARVERGECERALTLFLAPDPDSRTEDHEGRRVEKVEGGWLLLNYEKYRDKATKEEAATKNAARQKRYRERLKEGRPGRNDDVTNNGRDAKLSETTPVTDSASASAAPQHQQHLSSTTPKTACTQAGKPAKRAANGTSPSSLVWAAYAEAYEARYGCPPTRNARVNGQLAHFVKRVPVDDAPAIAATYVRSNNRRYVAAGHSVGCLLQDAEKLCTELTTGRQGTAHEAQAADRKDGRRGEYEEMFARLRAEDEAAGELDAN